MVACGAGASLAVRELLAHGASVSAVDDDGLTPLLHACWSAASVGVGGREANNPISMIRIINDYYIKNKPSCQYQAIASVVCFRP